jgi:ribosomal protein L11 methyltransferase
MKQGRLFRLSVATRPEAEEAVSELLQRLFLRPPTSWTDVLRGKCLVSLFLEKNAGFSSEARIRLADGIRDIRKAGLDVGSGAINFAPLPSENWAESWKRHFAPMTIGARLLLKPSWSRRHPRKGQSLIVLDPGLSFGTGHHPTTSFCLHQLVRRRKPAQPQSCLDLGTGSGILAIAAAKLGYLPVHAIDSDPKAIRIARRNARANAVSRIRFNQADVTRVPARLATKYSIVCANLVSTLIVSERKRLAAQLAPDGVLILAGILRREFPEVRRRFEQIGLRELAGKTEKEWRSAAFTWR